MSLFPPVVITIKVAICTPATFTPYPGSIEKNTFLCWFFCKFNGGIIGIPFIYVNSCKRLLNLISKAR